ncbi:MAG: DUF2867 domain-containing protein [Deltaproteobacteria bacterium]|nr:DUF2867 domain-containing protein [Deltaproteobacteria bacterium]
MSNDTIHALIHLGWAGAQPEMAVYIKTRGFMSRLYMAGISPFRHVVVYPALIRSVRRHWEEGAVP